MHLLVILVGLFVVFSGRRKNNFCNLLHLWVIVLCDRYIFFVTLLSLPESSFSVAFKMFDLDNSGYVLWILWNFNLLSSFFPSFLEFGREQGGGGVEEIVILTIDGYMIGGMSPKDDDMVYPVDI